MDLPYLTFSPLSMITTPSSRTRAVFCLMWTDSTCESGIPGIQNSNVCGREGAGPHMLRWCWRPLHLPGVRLKSDARNSLFADLPARACVSLLSSWYQDKGPWRFCRTSLQLDTSFILAEYFVLAHCEFSVISWRMVRPPREDCQAVTWPRTIFDFSLRQSSSWFAQLIFWPRVSTTYFLCLTKPVINGRCFGRWHHSYSFRRYVEKDLSVCPGLGVVSLCYVPLRVL